MGGGSWGARRVQRVGGQSIGEEQKQKHAAGEEEKKGKRKRKSNSSLS
ncbi:hypothetical protein SLEP1_g34419 [Rubroshorea leprosula]|uniref:Uncharacterized protein n=1 Tax=Rubroshorea leprosula TaxID=152421 RepID=A0AAV5KK39_9ROSI|nr:hypothetical protein SLEP1_g34419 [Rubroshorea leprosula]